MLFLLAIWRVIPLKWKSWLSYTQSIENNQSFDTIDEFSEYSMNESLYQKKPVNMQKQSATTLPIIRVKNQVWNDVKSLATYSIIVFH